MRLLGTAGLALMLLTPLACSSQQPPKVAEEKSVGYDVGGCSPTKFFVAHFELFNGDLSLTLFTDTPKAVEVIDPPILYKFKSEDKEGRHYFSEAETELVVKYVKDSLIGVQKKDGEVHMIIYGFVADGKTLLKSGGDLAAVCQGLRDEPDTAPSTSEPKKDEPKKQSSDSDDYVMPDYFGRKGPTVKI